MLLTRSLEAVPHPVRGSLHPFRGPDPEKEVPIVKTPYYLLLHPPSAGRARCCDDRPLLLDPPRTRFRPVRWSRKLRFAAPTAFRVFRRQLARPVEDPIEVGTPVVSSAGRELGTVREVVVELGSGRASYAVGAEGSVGLANVILLPRDVVRERDDVAIVEEHVLARLERRIA